MPRNGNGDYVLPAGNPVVPGTPIESEWANDTMNDLAAALSDSLTADGQTTPTANQPMGGWHHTGVSDPTLRNQYATLGMSQDGRNTRIQITGGTNNLSGTLVGQATAYSAGAVLSFFAPAINTGPVTLSYNGIAPASLVNSQGLPLQSGDLAASQLYLIQYTGTVFKMLTPVASQAGAIYDQSTTTGWIRPSTGTYPTITIATASSVLVPAGQGVIVPPGQSGADDAVAVSWTQQTISLTYVASAFSTTLAANSLGQIIQFSGRPSQSSLRNYIILGVATHIAGTVTNVTTTPAIFGDDGYLGTDTAGILDNVVVAGCKVTPNTTATLSLDVASGSISVPGGSPGTNDAPNVLPVAGGSAISFYTLADQNVVGGPVSVAPVASYDPNGSGTVTAIPANGNAVIHRLYYLYGKYIWVYGQTAYLDLNTALTYLDVDRSKYNASTLLTSASLLAEIIATKTTTDLAANTAAIISRGAPSFAIGTAGGVGEAPIDGNTYGRRNAAWSATISASVPQMTGNPSITNSGPTVVEVMSPVASGFAGINIKKLTFDWCNMEATHPDDKTYFRSYNPANGALRNSTEWNLATGAWTFPGRVLTANPDLNDTTVGSFMPVGAWGLGGTGGVVATNLDSPSTDRTGHYVWTSGMANFTPPSFISGGGLVFNGVRTTSASVGQAYQMVFSTSTASPGLGFRSANSSVWSPWFEMWTSANLPIQTSANDSTVGRVTLTGAFGWGAATVAFLGDWGNVPTVAGTYQLAAGSANPPAGLPAGVFNVICLPKISSGNSSYLAIGADNNYTFKLTRSNAGAWSTVVPIINTGIGDYGVSVPTVQTKAQTLASATTISASLWQGAYLKNTPTMNQTWTFSTALLDVTTHSLEWTLEIVNGGAFTQTWPGALVWAGGSAPVMPAVGTTVLKFYQLGSRVVGCILSGAVQNRTWNDRTASRALGTTYSNTSGRDMEVKVQTNSNAGPVALSITGTVNGLALTTMTVYANIAGYTVDTTFTVPTGQTYSVTSSNGILARWVELS